MSALQEVHTCFSEKNAYFKIERVYNCSNQSGSGESVFNGRESYICIEEEFFVFLSWGDTKAACSSYTKNFTFLSTGQTTKPQHSSPFIHMLYYCPPDREFFTQERLTLNKQEVQAARPLYGFKKKHSKKYWIEQQKTGQKKNHL